MGRIVNRSGLLRAGPIIGMSDTKNVEHGVSWGLTECGYDIRLKQDVVMFLGRRFVLASSIECFDMPEDLMGQVLNKSTWARRGVDASMTTNIEPGWKGHLTIELRYSGVRPIRIPAGAGIAQVLFHRIEEPAQYAGKYQDQPDAPVAARES